MKIYKYNIWKTPECVKFARGIYQEGNYAIGFGEDITSPDTDKEVKEITYQEYLDYVKSLGKDETQAVEIYNKYATLIVSDLFGEKVIEKRQVSDLLRKNVQSLFIDPNGLLTPIEYQVLIMSQVVCISLANSGTIKYSDVGIPSITDKNSADAYIQALLPLWSQVNLLNQQAIQFVQTTLA